jgi:hypothetical protein
MSPLSDLRQPVSANGNMSGKWIAICSKLLRLKIYSEDAQQGRLDDSLQGTWSGDGTKR